MFSQEEHNPRMVEVALKVLEQACTTLVMHLRFMNMALSVLKPKPVEKLDRAMATDGEYLFYNPELLLKAYRDNPRCLVRDYLHMVLHCVFSHFCCDGMMARACWDLACDIAVENVINELAEKGNINEFGLDCVHAPRQSHQMGIFRQLKDELKLITAEKVYHYYRERGLSDDELRLLQTHFIGDSHDSWYGPLVLDLVMAASNGASDSGNAAQGNGDGENQQDSNDEDVYTQRLQVMKSTWDDIAQHMQTELETFSAQRGMQAGGMTQNLRAVTREKVDYSVFLRRFATMGEAMKINDDEFDHIFYTYGMKLYDRMPLIEPLEYKEVHRIKEFVIALDTSGSVHGGLVQSFLNKTYNILQQEESFFTKVNIHIIQCDAEIQEAVKITKREEFDEYLKTMKLHGFGGTDFRPVFSYVNELIEKKELKDLKGMIYFTDGYGTFPTKVPDYKAVFVFVQDDYETPEIPPWAMRLILQKEDLQ